MIKIGSGSWTTVLFVMTIVNVFILIGFSDTDEAVLPGDIVGTYIDGKINTSRAALLAPGSENNIAVNNTFSDAPPKSSLPSIPGQQAVLAFLDALDTAFDFIVQIFNFIAAPLVIFSINGMPFFIKLIVGIPLTLLFTTSLIQFIRGAA